MNATNWLPGILVLSFGMMAAGLYILFGRGKPGPRAASAADLLADSERTLSLQLESLRELEANRHSLTPEQHLEEKSRLESLAVEALKKRDAQTLAALPGVPSEVVAPSSKGFFGRNPQLKGALWGAGLVVFFGGLWLLVNDQQKPRGETGNMTGATPGGAAESAPDTAAKEAQAKADAAEMQKAMEEVRSHPEDTDLATRVAHQLIRKQQFQDASQITERALGVDPFLGEARVHRAFLKAVVSGDPSGASVELEHLADTLPDTYEALLFLGMIHMQGGHNSAALQVFERYAKEAPADEQPPQMSAGIEALRREVGSGKP